jgi:hypothetical protein
LRLVTITHADCASVVEQEGVNQIRLELIKLHNEGASDEPLENKVGGQTDLCFQVGLDFEVPVVGLHILIDIPTCFDHVGGSLEAPLVIIILEKACLGAFASLHNWPMSGLSLMVFLYHQILMVVLSSDLGLTTANEK